MPSINELKGITSSQLGYTQVRIEAQPPAPFSGDPVPLSLPGNPAPNRGLIPIEYMYDFHVDRFHPDRPQFTRGTVDTNSFTRNTALLALSKTTQVF